MILILNMKKTLSLLILLMIGISAKAQWNNIDETLLEIRPTYSYHYVDTMLDNGNGIKLRTQMCLPDCDKSFPVVVVRCPYLPAEMNLDKLTEPAQYACRGLGYIIQNCRGTGGSEGQYQPNIYEREDGLSLANWLNDQHWVKSIGLTGTSYMSLTCWIIADILPEKVKCIHMHHYGVDRHLSAYNSGLFRQDILTAWSIDCAKEPINRPKKDPKTPYYDEERYMPQITMDVDLLGHELPWYRDWISHTEYTDPYWHQGVWATLRSIPEKVKVPVTIVAGHFDHHNEGTILGYHLLPAETKAKSRLIVGAWNHSFVPTPTIHNPTHDKEVNIAADAFNWMYPILMEDQKPEPEVLIYSIGEDRWHRMAEWPASEVYDKKTFYLSDKTSNGNKKALALNSDAKELPKETEIVYNYDPQNPVISVGGETLFTSEQTRGSILQPEIGYRDDVISFLSDPLSDNMTIDGKIRARIYFSTDVDDTALTFKVSEVMPDGSSVNIRSGITTLAFRNNRLGERQTYTPGEIVELEFEALPILWQVAKGHRIRIDISSSNFPEYAIHSNYAGVWSEQTKTRVAKQTIHIGQKYQSCIEIPLRK